MSHLPPAATAVSVPASHSRNQMKRGIPVMLPRRAPHPNPRYGRTLAELVTDHIKSSQRAAWKLHPHGLC
jgi:hypothetical protein